MRIVLDATVLQNPFTGVAKVTLALYQACLALQPTLQIEAWHRRPLAGQLPAQISSYQFGAYLPQRLWQQFALPLVAMWQAPPLMHFPWNGKLPRVGVPRTGVVITLHDVLPLIIPNYFSTEQAEQAYRQQIQRDLDRAHLLITDSTYSQQSIMRNFKVRSEPLVILGAPTLSVLPSAHSGNPVKTADYFLYVGGYDPRKGLMPLLNVFLALHEAKKLTSRLILTGTPYYFSAEFKQLVDKGKQLGIIEEKGYITDAELVTMFKEAQALLYPSKYEGFGLPPLEAMALGCPVLTTPYTSLPEICGEAALYADPADTASLAEAILALEHQPDLRRVLQQKGLAQARKFSWTTSAERYLQALERLIL